MSENSEKINVWDAKHLLKVREEREPQSIKAPDPDQLREKIEPWLTALFQSEHLSLLTGAGISSAVHHLATGENGSGMKLIDFSVFKEQIKYNSDKSAKNANRGEANIEDQIRIANELIKGLEIYFSTGILGSKKNNKIISSLKDELSKGISDFVDCVLDCERNIVSSENFKAAEYLMSFLMSFTSRSATRERLNIFTLNYDRIIEFGAELAGLHLIDRFVGNISPIFRSSRLKVDMHYNGYIHRIGLPYGADCISKYSEDAESIMIYPNAAKDRETSEYPYVELFRDFAAAICRPNSTIVVYGYSFGDEHINRVIADMLTIPSTHLVIIAYCDTGNRIQAFYKNVRRPVQISLLIGNHFGNLETLVDNYLPKPAIDRTTYKMAELLKARGYVTGKGNIDKEDTLE